MAPSREATAQCTGCPNASFAAAPRVFEAGGQLYDVAAADFDRDGLLDVAATSDSLDGPILLFPGNGRGGFAEPLHFAAPAPRRLVVGDFNRDGFPDLAFTFSNGPAIGVLLGGAGGRFGEAVQYPAGPEPWDLAVADFNGDGNDDVAVILNGSSGSAGVAILLATGTGTFGAPTTFPDGQYPRDVAASDVNHDGKVDLAITNVNENVVSILLGQGNGSFGARTTFPVPPQVFGVAIGYFNGDAHADLAVSGGGFFDPAALAILPGNGQGTFGAATVVAPISTSELEVLDFNKDGKDDLAARADGLVLLFGNGDATFQAPLRHPAGFSPQAFARGDFNSDGWTDFAVGLDSSSGIESLLMLLGKPLGLEKVPLYPGAFDPRAITVGDFNQDGRPDLAIADNSTRFYPAGSVSVLLSLPDGSLSPSATYLTVTPPTSIRTADFNGDGRLDLACASSSQMSILLGTGNGAFASANNYMLGNFVSGIDTADFNGDQKLDIVFSSYEGVTILFGDGMGAFGSPLNRSTDAVDSAPVAADFNLDGKVDVVMRGYRILYGDGTGHLSEVSYVDAGVSVQKFLVSDFNGDGRPDLAGIGVVDGGAVLLGQPTGGFGSPLPFPVEFDAYVRMAPTAADLDLDGKMDLAVLSGGNVSVLRGKGNGTFSRVGDVFVAALASDLVTADFNSDGRLDLAFIRATSIDASIPSDVSVLLNTNCLPRRLAIARNPSTCNLPGSVFEIQPIVKVYDDGDNVVACAEGSAQATILPGTGTTDAALGGVATAPLLGGTAAFGNLSIDLAGEGYILQFSTPGLLSSLSRVLRESAGCKGPFQFFTLTPCRVVDTRTSVGIWGAPALLGNSRRTFPIAGRCGVPATARSVAVNLTVVSPTDFGHLTLIPAGRPLPLASTINFRRSIIRANNAVLALGDAGDVDVQCTMPLDLLNQVDFILDVSGYFK